ncbi:tryptophan--tRNA ligase [Sharpea porci]|uniref:tryptophan--tRNA ligase n=1 Tax=Sharpea porci TaxID=2652286 RepID=UPI002409B318|nr:tryptophan--tRNA ligase [Sharpea porci]MDD6712393.1 tryptophan--tRNA ligase [Sharpea porci]MDY5280130.1 tryptophan--tRNA ligase [Sharpea porci]
MKRMLSGIKPTGRVTLGNYIGAIKPFVSFQDDYEMIIFVANLHSMTIYQEPKDLRQNTKDLIALYLAAGLDPEKVTLFLQSDVKEHAQLGWYLNCMVSMGELSRMTQYKMQVEKAKARKDASIGAGIFNYPSLMNADILMYDPDYVPVGDDQKQHVELARMVAERFNHRYSETFKIPEPLTPRVGGRIMSLQDPTSKMSKSDPTGKGCIYMLDPINISKKKIMAAVTDSDSHVRYDKENKPGISNLMEIYSILDHKSYEEIEAMYEGKGYGEFKKDLAEIVGAELQRVQDAYNKIMASGEIEKVLDEGAKKAGRIAYKKLAKVERKMGITIRK